MSLLTQAQVTRFHDDGFLIVENLLTDAIVQQLVERVDPLFAGEFEAGMYPDEWYWNPYLGRPHASAQMSNVWKSDRALASVVLSAKIGQMSAELGHWSGSRLISDSLWMKPYGASETTLHQDSMYNFYYTPQEIVVCWIALSQAIPGGSTIEYVRGSHKWTLSEAVPEFHAVNRGYRAAMEQAAEQAGITQPEVSLLAMPAGSCVFHHGHMWHGSNKNLMPNTVRRSLVVAHVPVNARFKSTDAYVQGGYLPGRYKRYGDDTMDESFFPIVWQQDGYRTPFLADYCEDALAMAVAC
ncbi:phytanoyl-CoA dioxygenase family protein [Stenomitos frigidus]|uniref:Phytanoyl-CoA dioxygenase family protein n=1 Tax=Stenomitos frigidus ULC18 TaxID=2107698 RepID=A0A2T1EIC5_9CYAN|nr:phytanoyl-CoA dioxygenase family protein [Stenomitos frigidus]PSB32435.1 phytanoyl-CoA dioxygenase family protein [Stenomitos frigidus ULC18]